MVMFDLVIITLLMQKHRHFAQGGLFRGNGIFGRLHLYQVKIEPNKSYK